MIQKSLTVKKNIKTAPRTLGGYQYGYIGIILSPATFTTLVPIQPFIPLIHPGILNVIHPAIQYEIALIKMLHDKSVHNFQSYRLIQYVLVQQILENIQDKYLIALLNLIKGQVTSDIRNIILHIFHGHVEITPQHLEAKYNAVDKSPYTIDEPIDVIFQPLKTQQKLENRQEDNNLRPQSCRPWLTYHF